MRRYLSGQSENEIIAGLREDSTLVASGIVQVDHDATDLESKLTLLSGLGGLLVQTHWNEDALVGRFLKKAGTPNLDLQSFPHLAQDIRLVKSVIATIANAKNDGLWPLAMLSAFQPQLSDALLHWTAGGYEDVRKEQESRIVKVGSHAHHMEQHFSLLPLWHSDAYHFSKDPAWFKQLECGTLELKSFMGCSSPGYIFAYALPHAVDLKFSSLRASHRTGRAVSQSF